MNDRTNDAEGAKGDDTPDHGPVQIDMVSTVDDPAPTNYPRNPPPNFPKPEHWDHLYEGREVGNLHRSIGVPLDVRRQLQYFLANGYSPEKAAGNIDLLPAGFQPWELDDISYKLDGEEATRRWIYNQLTELPDYRTAIRLKRSEFRQDLGIKESISEKTVGRITDEVAQESDVTVKSTLYAVIHAIDREEIHDDVLDPPPFEADGIGEPEAVRLSREMRMRGYGPIQLARDESRGRRDKWELMKPFEVAAVQNIHPNDAHEVLKQKPYYYSRDSPHAESLWTHLKDYSRAEIRCMFLCAFEQFLELLKEHGQLPEQPDIACDLTDFPWYGTFDTPDTPPPDQSMPEGVSGTKPSRNFSYSFKAATVSLTNCELPMTFGVRCVISRKHNHYHLKQLLKAAEAKFQPSVLSLDKDFYRKKVKNLLKTRDSDFIIAARRNMKLFDDLVEEALEKETFWNADPYEIGVPNTKSESQKDHWLVVVPSEKRLKKADTGVRDASNWDAYYTSLDPYSYDGGGEAIAQRHRLRWAIETSYAKMKHDFIPKSASSELKKREFIANLAMLYNAMWMCANVVYADDVGESVKDDHGRYHFTAAQFMTAMTDDFHEIDIGTIEDLSERSNMVKYAGQYET